MATARFPAATLVAFLLLCGGAQAADLPVLRADGTMVRRSDPGVAARDRTPVAHLGERRMTSAARAATTRRTVGTELRRMLDEGALDAATYRTRLRAYTGFRAALKRFSGRRRTDMAGVLAVLDGIAARGALTPSRLPALWLMLERNREWWNEGPLLAPGARVSFEGTELVWQYVPGEGLQFHPLANFGKLNALWRARGATDRLNALTDELMALPAERAGGLAWEYDFDFDGGRPPWVSSLAQGTALQALARAALKLGRGPELLPRIRLGLGIFRTPPPEGVRIDADGGAHYLQYSFAPGLQILNGFVQSLVGLYDFAAATGDPEAQQRFAEGDVAARAEVPASDTGAWSLYSRGSVTRESDLHYHGVLVEFLQSLCSRTADPVFCDAVIRFEGYEHQPPVLQLVTRRLRAGREGALRFRLSKISRVTVRLRRGSRTVSSRTAVLGGGLKDQLVDVPRRAGTYDVSIAATDLAGNPATIEGSVTVLRPRRR